MIDDRPAPQEKHGIEDLLATVLRNLCIEKPLDPLQYCIDSIQFSHDYAKQVGWRL